MSPDNVIEKMETKKIKVAKKKSKQEWPKVAIIILNWNGWKDTIECLESVFRNTYPNYQVIVVDNGSMDDSVEKIQAWADGKQEVLTPEPIHTLYHLSHPPVKKPIPYIYYTREEAEKGGNFKLEEKITKEWQERRKIDSKKINSTSPYPLIFIQTGENLGFAGGNNVGLRYALIRGDFGFFWLLNNDTVVKVDTLMHMVHHIKGRPSVGICGSTILYYHEPDKIWALGGASYNKWFSIPRHIALSRSANQMISHKKVESKMDYVVGASMIVSYIFLQDIGLMCEDFFLFFEELDWAVRAKGRYSLSYSHESIVFHKVSASTKSGNKLKKNNILLDYFMFKNRILFTYKYFPFALVLVLPAAFIMLLFKLFRGITKNLIGRFYVKSS